jgi:tyrosyl-tRNA synthetase
LSFKTGAEIAQMKKAVMDGANPRDIKINFAKEIVARFHDNDQAELVHQAFVERFQNKIIPDDLETQTISCIEESSLAQILKQAELTKSTSESIRLINQGAVKIDGEKVADPAVSLAFDTTYIIQVGKRRLAKLLILKSKS